MTPATLRFVNARIVRPDGVEPGGSRFRAQPSQRRQDLRSARDRRHRPIAGALQRGGDAGVAHGRLRHISGQNARLISRNTYRQPSVWNADLRLSKSFNLSHGMELEVLGECFNVFNKSAKVVTGANQDLYRITYTGN